MSTHTVSNNWRKKSKSSTAIQTTVAGLCLKKKKKETKGGQVVKYNKMCEHFRKWSIDRGTFWVSVNSSSTSLPVLKWKL